jgi:hypothetical protein
MNSFFSWLDRTVRTLCDRPDHLQRLSIVGAGLSIYPAVIATVGLLVWFALRHPDAPTTVVDGLFRIVYILLGLFALVVVSMLGTIKGLRIGPKGLEVETTFDDPDAAPGDHRRPFMRGSQDSDDCAGADDPPADPDPAPAADDDDSKKKPDTTEVTP